MPDIEVLMEQPRELSEVISLLKEHGSRAMLIAGGTDTVVDFKNSQNWPAVMISLAGIPGLDAIDEQQGTLTIGSLVTPNALVRSPLVRQWLPALAEAAETMASYQVRNLATLGGNLCSASPSADLPPTLMAAEAEVLIHGEQGPRRMPLWDFFTGVRRTRLGQAEVVTQVVVSPLPQASGVSYQVFKLRGANALAVASSAVRLSLGAQGQIERAIVVLGAVAPVPMVARETGEMLEGQRPSPQLFERAALKASEESQPIDDVRGTIAHRRELVRVLTRRGLEQALSRAQAGGHR